MEFTDIKKAVEELKSAFTVTVALINDRVKVNTNILKEAKTALEDSSNDLCCLGDIARELDRDMNHIANNCFDSATDIDTLIENFANEDRKESKK